MRDGGGGMRSPPRRHRIPHPASRIPPVPLTVPAPKRTRSSVPSAAAVSDPRRATARGAGRPSVGFRIGYDFDADHTFFGGQFNLPVGRRWTLVPSAELYLGVTGTPYRLNADLKYRPPTALGLFYFGGGFAYFHASGGGDAGGNVFA